MLVCSVRVSRFRFSSDSHHASNLGGSSCSSCRSLLRTTEILVNRRHRIHARLSCAFACRRPRGDHGDEHHDGAVVRRWVTAPRVCGAGGLVELRLEVPHDFAPHVPLPPRLFERLAVQVRPCGVLVRARTAPLVAAVPHAPRIDDVRFANRKIRGDAPDTVIGVRVGGHSGLASCPDSGGRRLRLVGTKENEVLRQQGQHGPLEPVRLSASFDRVRVLGRVQETLRERVQKQEVDDVPDLHLVRARGLFLVALLLGLCGARFDGVQGAVCEVGRGYPAFALARCGRRRCRHLSRQ